MIKYKCLFNYISQQNKLNIIIFEYIELHIMKQFSNEYWNMCKFICKFSSTMINKEFIN